MIIAMTTPQIRPQTPYFIFAAASGFIDKTSSTGSPISSHSASMAASTERLSRQSTRVHASRHVAGGASGKPWGLWDRCYRGRSHRRAVVAEAPPAAHSRRSPRGPPYHACLRGSLGRHAHKLGSQRLHDEPPAPRG